MDAIKRLQIKQARASGSRLSSTGRLPVDVGAEQNQQQHGARSTAASPEALVEEMQDF